MISRMMTGILRQCQAAPSEIACGIWVNAMTQPRMLDTPIRNTTMPLILALSTTMFQKDFKRDIAVADAQDQSVNHGDGRALLWR